MAYNEKHLAKLADLKALGTKQKEVADALAARVDTLENVGSQANVLEGVKVNGTALAIANKMVDILIATGSKNGSISVNGADVAIKGLAALAFKAKVSQSDLDDALAAVLEGKADKATTLDGYGITNAYTKDEINAKISSVYKPAGAVAFAELPSLSESILGNVYNVTDAFTTTANFVEGANIPRAPMSWWSRSAMPISTMCWLVSLTCPVMLKRKQARACLTRTSLRLSRISWTALRLAQTSMSIPPTPLLPAVCTRPPWMKRAM